MRRTLTDTKLLREYVRNALLEDEAGGNTALFGGSTAGFNAYDASFSHGSGGGAGAWGGGSAQDLHDTFIGPFVDVFKTAVGKTKEITKRTRTLLWVGLQTVLTTLIPIYGYNYAEVFDKEKEDIEKIRGEYKDVYDRTEAALSGPDATLLAFMASPALTLGAFAAKAAPEVTKGLFSAVSGGLSDEIYDGTKSKLEAAGRWLLGDDTDGKSRRRSSGKKGRGRSPSDFFGEAHLKEEKDSKDKKGKKYGPEDLLKSKKMIQAVAESEKAKKMAADATKIYRKTLADVFAQAEEVLKRAKTIEDLEKIAGKKAKGDLKAKIAEIKKLPPQEKATAEKMLVDGSRKASKEFYVKSLTDTVSAVVKGGVPEESQFVKDYRETIAKIKAL